MFSNKTNRQTFYHCKPNHTRKIPVKDKKTLIYIYMVYLWHYLFLKYSSGLELRATAPSIIVRKRHQKVAQKYIQDVFLFWLTSMKRSSITMLLCELHEDAGWVAKVATEEHRALTSLPLNTGEAQKAPGCDGQVSTKFI